MATTKKQSRKAARRKRTAATSGKSALPLVGQLRALLLAAAGERLRADFTAQLAAERERGERLQQRLLARIDRRQRELGLRLTRLQLRVTRLGRHCDRALRELAAHADGERLDDRVLAIAEADRLRHEFHGGLRELEQKLHAALAEMQHGKTDRQQLAHLLSDVAQQVKLPHDRSA